MEIPAGQPYRPEIDGLRAVAVAAVVLYHLGVAAPGGFVGVDVFFVISGYVITRQLAALQGAPLGATLLDFYARRARRIVPALVLVLLTTLLLGTIFLLPWGEQQELGRSTIAAALFIANANFQYHAFEYFGGPAELQPLLHTWSLAVEAQFYLAWPLLLALAWKLAPPVGKRFGEQAGRWFALGLLAALSFVSLVMCVEWTREDPPAAFYQLPARFWELGVGAALALAGVRGVGHRVLAPAGLAGIAAAILLFSRETPYPGFAAVLPVAAAALVIAGGAREGLTRRILASRPLVFTGRVSYAWYLWHWALLSINRIVHLGAHDLATDTAAVVVAFGLAWASTRWLEEPIRQRRWTLVATPGRAIATCAALLAVTASLGAALWLDARETNRRELLTRSIDCFHAPGNLVMHDEAACVLAKGDSGVIYLVGDSHADHWSPAVASWAKANRASAIERTFLSCIPPLSTRAGPDFLPSCPEFSRKVLDEILAQADSGRRVLVVISANWIRYAHLLTSGADSGLSSTLAVLEARGIPVLVIGPTPRFALPAPACAARAAPPACRLARKQHDADTAAAQDGLRALMEGRPRAQRVDPTPAFCDEHWCDSVRDGQLDFRDERHLTPRAAERALGVLRPSLDRAWADAARRAPANTRVPPVSR